MDTLTIQKASLIWEYMASYCQKVKTDAVVICCSYDLRVCDYACELIKSGLSENLVISGNTGNWTKYIWSKPEAIIFNERALSNGIDSEKITLEPEATNFGENVTLSKSLLPNAKSVMFVSKPNSMLRVKLTAESQWSEINSFVSCPTIEFPHDVSNVLGILGVINEMVGDISRIQKYPKLGFQSPHELPENILEAYDYLIDQGFTMHI